MFRQNTASALANVSQYFNLFEALPDEVLLHIFSYLSIFQLANISQTDIRSYRIAYHRTLGLFATRELYYDEKATELNKILNSNLEGIRLSHVKRLDQQDLNKRYITVANTCKALIFYERKCDPQGMNALNLIELYYDNLDNLDKKQQIRHLILLLLESGLDVNKKVDTCTTKFSIREYADYKAKIHDPHNNFPLMQALIADYSRKTTASISKNAVKC